MAFQPIAYSQNVASSNAFTKLNGVLDQTVKVSDTVISVPSLNQLLGAIAFCGSGGNDARLIAPSLRRINPQYINPVLATTGPDKPLVFNLHTRSPIPLVQNEGLQVEVKADDGGVADQKTVVVFLADGALGGVTGAIRTVNFEVTIALTGGEWTFSEISLPDDLPVGSYQVVGARLVCSPGIAFRFVPVGAANRPGGLCAISADANDIPIQRDGGMGAWFTFNSIQPPGIEILASSNQTQATYEGYMDIIAT